ncbi:MAG: thermonuclease family protein [Lacipirellulaceae bacterium]
MRCRPIAAAALAAALLCSLPQDAAAAGPSAALTMPCVVTEVYDGDTLTVRVSIDLRVRLLDCWAPEIRTTAADEKRRGEASAAHLRNLAAGQPALLSVPLGHARRLDDLLTMGRVLGHVWLEGDAQSLSTRQVAAGHATIDKQ